MIQPEKTVQNANWWWANVVLLSPNPNRHTIQKQQKSDEWIGERVRVALQRITIDFTMWIDVSEQRHLMVYTHVVKLHRQRTNYVMKLFETIGLMTSSVSSVLYQINVYLQAHTLCYAAMWCAVLCAAHSMHRCLEFGMRLSVLMLFILSSLNSAHLTNAIWESVWA